MSVKRKKYTKEFKTESVEYFLKSGKSMKDVSESVITSYSIHYTKLYDSD